MVLGENIMMKKYIISFSIGLCIMLGSTHSSAAAADTDSSCSTLCPTCPKKFLNFCRLCTYKKGILEAECQDANKPAAFVTTSCPVIINQNTQPAIDTVDGKLQCDTTPQEPQIKPNADQI